MPLLFVAFFLFVILAAIALTPFTIIQRYRMGTARRRARRWTATLNAAGLAFSSSLFVAGAAVGSFWVPNALTHTIAGFAAGCLLGLLGLTLNRWETAAGALYYKPNRWLVLGITSVVAARLLFGFWRSWHAWQVSGFSVAAAGATGSLAAGAVVLGYYLTFWLGIRQRLRI